jgi:hypothetical protein
MARKRSHRSSGYGSILGDELMPLREAGRRLGIGSRGLAEAQRQGLRTVQYGRMKYVFGDDLFRFFDEIRREDPDHDQGQDRGL